MSTGSPVEFTFIDDLQWRNSIHSITYTYNSLSTGDGNMVNSFQKTAGKIVLPSSSYFSFGTYVWTIKATGFADRIVTVTVN